MIVRAPRISAAKRTRLIKCFAMDLDATRAAVIAKVSRPCANRWYRDFRERVYRVRTRAPRLTGEVEVDQAFFGGRGKKKDAALVRQLAGLTRKQLRAKAKKIKPEKQLEVVCFYQRGGEVYTHTVGDSSIETMLPLMRLVVEPGATIYTDKWPSFNPLTADGYKHYAINHSHEYRDRRGRHINGVDRFVSYAKVRLGPFFGIRRSTLPLHIRECEWRWNLGVEDRSVTPKERYARVERALKALL